MSTRKPTMRDIGKALGTSAVTVSKALAGKEGMSDRLRDRILKKAEEMGYAYPGGNKMVRRGQLDIGILIPDRFLEADSFYNLMYKKLIRRLAEEGHFGLLEILTHQAETDRTLPNLIRNRHVDGLILLGQPGKPYYRMIAQCGTPAVFMDFYDEHGNADAVVGDNTYGTYRLTSHLIRIGHTRIGFVGNQKATSSIMDRYLGYYRAMLVNSLPVREDWILMDRTDEGEMIPLELPEELPTAFVCNCDVIARKLIVRLQEAGKRVPEDVSVTGFDDFEIGPEQTPALSTFRVNTDGMINLAVNAICDRCAGSEKPFGRMVVGGQPVYRESDTPCIGNAAEEMDERTETEEKQP